MIQEIVEGQNLRSETFLSNRFYFCDWKKWESSLGKEKRASNQIRGAQKAKRYLPYVITNANTYKYKHKYIREEHPNQIRVTQKAKRL